MTRWIIWLAIVSNLVVGIMLFASPDPMHTTPIHMGGALMGSRYVIAIASILAGALAFIALRRPTGPWSIVLVMPQQMMLYVGALGSLQAIVEGHYADGVPRSHWFIAADQHLYVLAAIMHTLAVVEAYLMKAKHG